MTDLHPSEAYERADPIWIRFEQLPAAEARRLDINLMSGRVGKLFGALRLLLPVYDGAGDIIALKSRPINLDKSGSRTLGAVKGGIMANRAAHDILSGIDTEPQAVVIVEGETDLWAWQSMLGSERLAVFATGQGLWSPEVAARIPAGSRVYLRTDLDDEGERYAERIARTLAHRCECFRLRGEQGVDDSDRWLADELDRLPATGCVRYVVGASSSERQHREQREQEEPDENWSATRGRAYVQAAIDRACDDITSASEHGRNQTLNRAAYGIGRVLHLPGAVAREAAMAALVEAGRSAGLKRSECRRTVKSGLDAGERHKRTPESRGRPDAPRSGGGRPGGGSSPAAAAQEEPATDEAAEPSPAREMKAAPAAHWTDRLITTQRGGLRNCQANVNTIMCNDPAWLGVLAFDEFANVVRTLQCPPWGPDEADSSWQSGQEWQDQDDSRTRCWIMREHYFEPAAEKAYFGARQVAFHNAFHPVRDYLSGLEWDGVERVDRWLAEYCSAEDCEHNRLVGRWWLISGVARVFEPGCQVDHVLVLEGHVQGEGKSSAFRALMPDVEWFHGSKIDIGSKDGLQTLQGVWLLELAELDGITSKKAAEELKAFLTCTDDRFRPPYGRALARWQRQCFFGATVNSCEYLRDMTGNRRWWPVKTPLVDVAKISADRDQLWAEAVHLYRDNQQWWPSTQEHREMLADRVDARTVADPWEDRIADWLDTSRGSRPITVTTILEDAIRIEQPGKMDTHDSRRVGQIMQRLGYDKERRRVDGRRQYVYEPRDKT